MRYIKIFVSVFLLWSGAVPAWASVPSMSFTVTTSEAVNVDTGAGTPRIVLDVDGVTRYATYASGTGTANLTFTYTATAGDADLNGIGISSSNIDLNGGSISDLNGNPLSSVAFTAPVTSGVKVDYPSLAMDFLYDSDGRYTLNGTVYNDLSSFLGAAGGSFTRASVGTYFDSSGVLQTASSGTPRFDYDPVTNAAKGILIEESRTNVLANSQASGAVAGTPGTLPTGWSIVYNPSGFSTQIVGSGTQNGMQYIDLRIYNNTVASEFQVQAGPCSTTTSGTVWTGSLYLKIVGGSTTGFTQIRSRMTWRTSGGAYVGQSATNVIGSLGATNFYRGIVTAAAPATTGKVCSILNLYAGSTALDLTLRIAAPQLEQGYFATSYIPTTAGAVTRQADNLIVPTSGGWFDASEGALMTQGVIPFLGGTTYPRTATLTDGTLTNYMALYVEDAVADARRSEIVSGGGVQMSQPLTAYSAGTTLRQGVTYQLNNSNIAMGGTLGTTDTSVTVPTVTSLAIGGHSASVARYLNGWMQKVKYYPRRVGNTQLQLLTQ